MEMKGEGCPECRVAFSVLFSVNYVYGTSMALGWTSSDGMHYLHRLHRVTLRCVTVCYRPLLADSRLCVTVYSPPRGVKGRLTRNMANRPNRHVSSGEGEEA